MKKTILFCLLTTLIVGSSNAKTDKSGYPITPVPFTAVKVAPSSFWGQRLQASRDVTIPLAFSKCESEHRYDNFLQAAEHVKDPTKTFEVTMGFPFDDTDPYKTLEDTPQCPHQRRAHRQVLRQSDKHHCLGTRIRRLPLYCPHAEPRKANELVGRQALGSCGGRLPRAL